MKQDTNTGRHIVRDMKSGRTFVVECIHERNDKDDGDWQNGGIDKAKHRGSINREESIITKENGFTTIIETKESPYSIIEKLLL